MEKIIEKALRDSVKTKEEFIKGNILNPILLFKVVTPVQIIIDGLNWETFCSFENLQAYPAQSENTKDFAFRVPSKWDITFSFLPSGLGVCIG